MFNKGLSSGRKMLQEQIEQTGENVKFILDVIFNTNIQRILNMYQIQRRIALKIMWDKTHFTVL